MEIRRARRGDLPAILRLFAEDVLHGASESAVDPAERLRDVERAFDEIDADARERLFVADEEGRVVGTFQLTFTRYLSRGGALSATIESVQVEARERNRGIGAAMMRHAIDEARKRGCCRVQLTSNKARKDAHRFYARLGFVASHEGMKLFL